MSNGEICIANGNALLVCFIWFHTGAALGRLSVKPRPHSVLLGRGFLVVARLPLVV